MKKTVLVIGIDAFGEALVNELYNKDAIILAIDQTEANLIKVQEKIQKGATLDTTCKDSLIEFGVKDVDIAVVCFAQNIEKSILTSILLNEIFKKNIYVVVDNEYHEIVITKLGMKPIFPSKLLGIKAARQIIYNDYLDSFDIGKDYGIYEIITPIKFVSKAIKELKLRENFSINIIFIIRNQETFFPDGNFIFLENDIILLVAKHKDLKNIC